MKILIVEDEYWVRKSIVSMLEKEKNTGMEIKEAENGEEAIALMEKEKMDIILTDIEMPFIDGLQLIRWIKKNQKDSVTGVISGYSDFPLVKEALLNGALDYILKPVKLENLKECIKKMEEEAKRRHRENTDREQHKKNASMYESYLQDMEFSRFITAKQKSAPVSWEDYGLKPSCRMMVLRYRNREDINKNSMDTILEEKERIKNLLKNIFQTDTIFWNTFRGEEYVIFTEGSLTGCREKSFRLVQKDPLFLCVSIGERQKTPSSIPSEYRNLLLKIVKNERYKGKKEIFDYTQPDPLGYSHLEEAQKYLTPLKKELENKNPEQVKKIVMDYMGLGKICEDHWFLFEIRQVIQRIKSTINKIFQSSEADRELEEGDSLFDSLEQALEIENTREFTELLLQIIKHYTSRDQSEEGNEEKDLIQKVKKYVDEHYMDNISLSNIAEKFFVTPSYLSRSFKKTAGINLISYITDKRIQTAKEYMESGNLKLSEIAFLAGYDDYTYFNKVFKRHTGYSPKDYQTKLKKSNI